MNTKKKRRLTLTALLLPALVLAGYFVRQANRAPDDCSWRLNGHHRPAKERTPADGAGYTNYRGGRPISVNEFFKLACSLDPQVPASVPKNAMKGLETMRVTLRGYLLAARFQRAADHDFHAEIAATPQWNSEHIIVEVPPGEAYCATRKALWNMVRTDVTQSGGWTFYVDSAFFRGAWVFQKPPEVLITGYLLLDSGHAHGHRDYCTNAGGRGVRRPGENSKVRGLWEIHPVLSIQPIGQRDKLHHAASE